jgi:hypothetical protein
MRTRSARSRIIIIGSLVFAILMFGMFMFVGRPELKAEFLRHEGKTAMIRLANTSRYQLFSTWTPGYVTCSIAKEPSVPTIEIGPHVVREARISPFDTYELPSQIEFSYASKPRRVLAKLLRLVYTYTGIELLRFRTVTVQIPQNTATVDTPPIQTSTTE